MSRWCIEYWKYDCIYINNYKCCVYMVLIGKKRKLTSSPIFYQNVLVFRLSSETILPIYRYSGVFHQPELLILTSKTSYVYKCHRVCGTDRTHGRTLLHVLAPNSYGNEACSARIEILQLYVLLYSADKTPFDAKR